jgi:predicted restriction endonuclease
MPYKDKRKERQSKHDRYEERKNDPDFVTARQKYRDEHADKNRQYQEIYRLTHAKELAQLKQRRKSLWKSSQKEYTSEYLRQYVAKYREDVLTLYGRKCECCGESNHEFLQVDHINGDGGAHRKAFGKGHTFYRWLVRQGKRMDDFRLLCSNCNWSHGKWGYCPHDLQRSHPEKTRTTEGGDNISPPI